MASWVDFLSLTATVAVIGGVIYGIKYVIHSIETGWTSTKESLKTKGLDVSRTGISVKTSRRFDHEDYMDATQRNLVKVVAASSFNKATSATPNPSPVPFKMERHPSEASSVSSNEKKKGIFRLRK